MEKKCLQNIKYLSDYRCERTSMAAKYKTFVNVDENLIRICKNKYGYKTTNKWSQM